MTFFSFFASLPIFNLDQKLLDLGAEKSNVGFRLRRPVFKIQTLRQKTCNKMCESCDHYSSDDNFQPDINLIDQPLFSVGIILFEIEGLFPKEKKKADKRECDCKIFFQGVEPPQALLFCWALVRVQFFFLKKSREKIKVLKQRDKMKI